MIYDKYGVDVHSQEFKVIHRVAGDRILFSLHNRLPCFGYSQLINKINSNPNPRLEVYLSIQLFEPYSNLFYIARRLKFYKVISYYRIDENGYTYIALRENTRAFKFTNVEQLNQLNIAVPQEIYNEMYHRKVKNTELETEAASRVLNRALELRPDIQNQQQQQQSANKSFAPLVAGELIQNHDSGNQMGIDSYPRNDGSNTDVSFYD